MVDKTNKQLSIVQQCELLSVSRSGYYYEHRGESKRNLEIMKLIDKIHTDYPFYGFRRIRNELRKYDYFIGKKLVVRLMKLMAIDVIYPKQNTSKPNPGDTIYPYLLRGLKVDHCHQVWEMDITYIAMSHGFMYLAAIIDVHSRMVVNWDVSNTMEASWCKKIVAGAIAGYGCPEIFNTDQGSQFTSSIFTGYLLDNKIKVSMDGRGRAKDNIFIERLWRSVKQENIYLNAYENGQELYAGLTEYFYFYNYKRPHQSLDYMCPAELCENKIAI
jgi:Transposase and inactivated derivatives